MFNSQCSIQEELTGSIKEAFDLRPSELISLVGGGGKTSLMFALSRELVGSGNKIVTTTTTRIMPPTIVQSPCVIIESDEARLLARLRDALTRTNHVTVARLKTEQNKLKGLSPETVEAMFRLRLADYVINEADGSARKSIKAPNSTEPVIPANTSLIIAVVGLDALGQPLSSEIAFRPECISSITGLAVGEKISRQTIASLLTHPQGITQQAPTSARIVPFLNKLDLILTSGQHNLHGVSVPAICEAKALAAAILARNHPQIRRVVMGAADRVGQPFHVVKYATGV